MVAFSTSDGRDCSVLESASSSSLTKTIGIGCSGASHSSVEVFGAGRGHTRERLSAFAGRRISRHILRSESNKKATWAKMKRTNMM